MSDSTVMTTCLVWRDIINSLTDVQTPLVFCFSTVFVLVNIKVHIFFLLFQTQQFGYNLSQKKRAPLANRTNPRYPAPAVVSAGQKLMSSSVPSSPAEYRLLGKRKAGGESASGSTWKNYAEESASNLPSMQDMSHASANSRQLQTALKSRNSSESGNCNLKQPSPKLPQPATSSGQHHQPATAQIANSRWSLFLAHTPE